MLNHPTDFPPWMPTIFWIISETFKMNWQDELKKYIKNVKQQI